MPALQVKDCPESLYEDLKTCASLEDRSIAQQTIHILKQYLKVYKTNSQNASNQDSFTHRNVLHDCSADYSMLSSGLDKQSLDKRYALEQIASLPELGLPKGYSSTADLIREDRDS